MPGIIGNLEKRGVEVEAGRCCRRAGEGEVEGDIRCQTVQVSILCRCSFFFFSLEDTYVDSMLTVSTQLIKISGRSIKSGGRPQYSRQCQTKRASIVYETKTQD